MTDRKHELTQLLRAGVDGEQASGDLLELVYDELRSIARGRMSGERGSHTLQATALVHEAYMRLCGSEPVAWEGRRHFYAAAAEAMRRILIDHARKQKSAKRGGDALRVTLGAVDVQEEFDSQQVLALTEALERLEAEDERAASVVRLRFFSGLTMEEIAQALEISERTAHREWTYARARLFQILGDDEA